MSAIDKGGKKAAAARWYASHREAAKARMKEYRNFIKDCVFQAYGGYLCSCCQETNPKFLTIDHVNSDGAEHRRVIKCRGGIGIYIWLVNNNFPPGFQVLCYNCNLGRARNKGLCPHKEKDMRANPLGHLEMELIQDKTNISSFGSASGYDDLIRDQVPVKDSLTGADTFKQDASKPSSRAKVETDRMHVDGGADLKGASMYKEFGGGTGKSAGEFTSDKSK